MRTFYVHIRLFKLTLLTYSSMIRLIKLMKDHTELPQYDQAAKKSAKLHVSPDHKKCIRVRQKFCWWYWVVSTEAHARTVTEVETGQSAQSPVLHLVLQPALRSESGRIWKQTLIASDAVQIRLAVRLSCVYTTALNVACARMKAYRLRFSAPNFSRHRAWRACSRNQTQITNCCTLCVCSLLYLGYVHGQIEFCICKDSVKIFIESKKSISIHACQNERIMNSNRAYPSN